MTPYGVMVSHMLMSTGYSRQLLVQVASLASATPSVAYACFARSLTHMGMMRQGGNGTKFLS